MLKSQVRLPWLCLLALGQGFPCPGPPIMTSVAELMPPVAACMCVAEGASTWGEQGHVEEDSAASPKKRRRRAG